MQNWPVISRFFSDDTAAITVDWVVLTAALVTVGIAVVLVVQSGLESNASVISSGISTAVASALS